MHPPGGQGGMRAGTWKSVSRFHTHVWFTLNTVKSSGLHSRGVVLVRDRERAALEVVDPVRVVLRRRRAGADVVRVRRVADVASFRGRVERSGTLVARNLGSRGFASLELEDVPRVRGVGQVVVEPPFCKVHVLYWDDRAIVVGECLLCDVKSPHARVPESLKNISFSKKRGCTTTYQRVQTLAVEPKKSQERQ